MSIASTHPIILSCVLCHVLLTCKPVNIDYVFIISKDANIEGTDFDGFSRALLILRIYLAKTMNISDLKVIDNTLPARSLWSNILSWRGPN